ncbi:MAG: hypothetical protein ACE5LF_09730, partial [Alphaproteobacteria bacterium]
GEVYRPSFAAGETAGGRRRGHGAPWAGRRPVDGRPGVADDFAAVTPAPIPPGSIDGLTGVARRSNCTL